MPLIPPPALHVRIAAAPRRADARAIAAALAIERADLSAATPMRTGDAAARARAILADRVFVRDPAATPEPPSLWQLFWNWVGAWPLWRWLHGLVRPLFRRITAGRVNASAAGYVALGLASLVLVAVVARLASGFFAHLGAPDRASRQASAVRRDPFDDAEAAARRGDFTAAVTAAFSAALVALDRHDIVPFDGSRTPGEYRRAVRRAAPAFEMPFARIANAFVITVYGARAADAELWNGVRDAYGVLQAGEAA